MRTRVNDLLPKTLPALLATACCMLACGVAVPSASATSPPNCSPPSRPNFVFIFTDDQDVGSMQYMPRTRRLLGEEGVTFRNMFVTNPICCPSSVSVLTGMYSRNHQIVHNIPPLGGFQKFRDLGLENSTMATWLHDAGYYTGRVGKYQVGYPVGTTYVPPGWDEWHCSYDGFTTFFNYMLNENGVVVHYGDQEDDYITDVLARKSVEFLESAEEVDEQPFLLFLAPNSPHSGVARNGPPDPAPRHLGTFAGLKAPRPPSFNEADVSDKPPGFRDLPLLTDVQIAALDREHQARVEAIQSIDEAVEAVVEALEDLGELDNTYIFFTSDNGYHLGLHRLYNGKAQVYEEDIRVPLLVRGPGIRKGRELDQLVLNIDMAPTIAELAGVVPAHQVDGRSMVPLLDHRGRQWNLWRRDFVVEIYRLPGQLGEQSFALHGAEAVYFEGSTSGPLEYYWLRRDPFQINNLVNQVWPGYLNLLSRRLAWLVALRGAS